jgi:hypothetical protein
MRKLVLAIAGGLAALTACVGAPPEYGGPFTNQPSAGTHTRLEATGKARQRYLYVTGGDPGEVTILSEKRHRKIGVITDDIVYPIGDTLDSEGNLYVANAEASDVTEYAPGTSSPSFTYNAGMRDPADVTVDRAGNVYESDSYAWGSAINEYVQRSNVALNSCTISGYVQGVAVDKKGDVFTDYRLEYYPYDTRLLEYKGGLSGCSGTLLQPTLKWPGGMTLDRHDNLLVCDSIAGTVDVIEPPYSKINATLMSGLRDVTSVRLNRSNTRAYVTQSTESLVYIVAYPSGKVIATIRVTGAQSAVAAPNAVY